MSISVGVPDVFKPAKELRAGMLGSLIAKLGQDCLTPWRKSLLLPPRTDCRTFPNVDDMNPARRQEQKS